MDDTIIYTDGSLEYFRDKARRLERENAALRERLDSVQKSHFTLSKDNAELRKDKERLDFLGQTKCAYYYEGTCCWRINDDKDTDGDTLRAAIDAARKEAQP